jgi:hypothetical protein
MAYQSIGRGASANDGTGDDLRTGAGKINANFVELYTVLGDGSTLTSDTVTLNTATQTLTNKTLTAPTINGGTITADLTGDVTGDVTGNADTATALETARTIAGQSFDGTANITIAATDLSDTDQSLATTDNVTFAQVTADLVGDVTGNVTGNLTGNIVGNADTASALASPVNIAGQSFDGTASISISASDLSDVNQALATTDSVTFASVTADLTGDVTGNVTGDLTGDVTGNVTGNVDGIVGGTTPAAGSFTDLSATGGVQLAVFADTTDRDSNVTASAGMIVFVTDGDGLGTAQFQGYDGSAWVALN